MSLKIALLVLIFSLASLAKADWDEAKEWSDFKIKFHKKYSSPDEEKLRKTIWGENLKFIEKHNKEADEKLHTFRVGMNKFGDMTSEEFRKFLGPKTKLSDKPKPNLKKSSTTGYIPDQVDWRVNFCVGPVREESLYCRDGYAFNTAECISGVKCAATRQPYGNLSVQQILDCSRSFGNLGCDGGYYDQTYKYIINTGGIEDQDTYPYEGRDGQCRFTPQTISASISSYVDVKTGDESELTNVIANNGPVTVAVDAGQTSFQFYASGIYYEPNCSSTEVDHLMLIIGYGMTPKPPITFYVVKNSWGTSWGEKGYIRMSRYRDNNCGIASFASYPVL